MGNIPSTKTDYAPEQHSEQGMREIGLEFDKKYPLRGPFFIEGRKPEDGIYGFQLYYRDEKGNYTPFFSFETARPLRNQFKVEYKGQIVKFVFETDSFEKGLKHIFEYSFDFSKSFESEKDFTGYLLSIPYLLPSITNLDGPFWYYITSVDATYHKFYIVKLSDEKKPHGFESTFENGDTVIDEIIVKSSNFPKVMNNENGDLVIVSNDEGFVPIPICLPMDVLTLAKR
jgi:hypothetical protein